MENDLNSEKARVHENKTNEGKKTRIGKVMVMVGGD